MKAGSTGRRGNSNSSYILPDPKLNRIVLGKELKAGSSARTSPCPASSTGQPKQRGAPADRPTDRAGGQGQTAPHGHRGTAATRLRERRPPPGLRGTGRPGAGTHGPGPHPRAEQPRHGPGPHPRQPQTGRRGPAAGDRPLSLPPDPSAQEA